MQLDYSLQQGLIYGSIFTGYIFILMITLSPRIWGYTDYPETVKRKVPPQTRRERTIAGIVSVPFFLFAIAYPAYSVLALRDRLGGVMAFSDAFIHLLMMVIFMTIGDLVILDWFIISKVTPGFVVVPGSEVEDYKDFSHHYWGHLRGTIIMIVLCAAVAVIVSRQ
ncbi:hypothetical protein ES703_49137 [subsurface metagenome]